MASTSTPSLQSADKSNTPHPHPLPTPRRRTAATSSSSPDPDSLHYAVISGVAGGLAACIAKTSVAPMDRVKILFQTRSPDYQRYAGTWLGLFRAARDIYQESGVRGLLQGHSATLLRIFPYAAIKYASYDKIHIMLMPTPQSETSSKRFTAGALAGVTCAITTYPLELIRVRLAFEHHSPTNPSSLKRTIKQIYLEPPLPLLSRVPSPSSNLSTPPTQAPKPSLTHFYRGIFPTIFGIIPYAGTSFLMWGFLKHDLFPSLFPSSTLSSHKPTVDLVAGGIAGAVGQTAAYPLDIVRRRMQVGPALAPGQRVGFFETAKNVYKLAGWRGFFVGLSIGYLKVVPMNAVSFASWEALKVMFGLEARER